MLFLIAVATLVSEDLTCIGVGLLAGQGRIEFLPGVLACFAGIYVGDILLYLAGRFLGRPAIAHRPLRWFLRSEHVDISSEWFNRRGAIVIGLSRFIPGTRLPTYFAAGLLKTSFWSFCFYFFLAVAAWTPVLVGLSMFLGERSFRYFEVFQRHAFLAFAVLGLWILFVVKLVFPLFSFRGRRRLYGKLQRIRNWEFWPPWIFYPPVVAYVLWLGLRHRSPLLFTAANPAIEGGGFISESKQAILEGLATTPEFVARSRPLPFADDANRVEAALGFMAAHGIDFPVVLKPDAGQRGSGVAVVRSRSEMEAYLEDGKFDAIVQEYVPGRELGIFYYRYPGEDQGRIFSITDKRMPVLTGDGTHTLEELVLLDRRAVCLADHYLHVQADRIGDVPAAGEKIELVELGTHCLGAIFEDGAALNGEPLRDAIDRISRAYSGFYFGRYDLRTPDVEDLRRGRNFKIIELNGVTSEATHIYDRRLGLLDAYRTLFRQWSIAFEIGKRNRARGVAPVGLSELVRLLVRYVRTRRTHPR